MNEQTAYFQPQAMMQQQMPQYPPKKYFISYVYSARGWGNNIEFGNKVVSLEYPNVAFDIQVMEEKLKEENKWKTCVILFYKKVS